MIKKILIALIITSCYAVNLVNAQVKKDTKDTAKTVIIFNSNASTSKKSYSIGNSIIKIDPMGFIFGKIPVSYERRISDLLSVQVSGGLTTKNYLKSLWAVESMGEAFDEDVDFKDAKFPDGFKDETDPLNSFEHRKAALGYMASIEPKIYLSEDALEGSFIGLNLSYLRYNYTTQGLVNDGSGAYKFTGATKKEYENVKSLIVSYGYQKLYDTISLEYSTGIGLRSVSGQKYTAGDSNAGFYESLTKYSKKTGIAFDVSLKVGFQL